MSDPEPMRVVWSDRLWCLYWFGPERLLLRVEQYWRHYWVLVTCYGVISLVVSMSGRPWLGVLISLCAMIFPVMLHINAEHEKNVREADDWIEELIEFEQQVNRSQQSLANLGMSAQQAAQGLNQMASLMSHRAGPNSGSVHCLCDACDDSRNRYNPGGPVT